MDYLFVGLSMMCYAYFYCIGFLGYVLPFLCKKWDRVRPDPNIYYRTCICLARFILSLAIDQLISISDEPFYGYSQCFGQNPQFGITNMALVILNPRYD